MHKLIASSLALSLLVGVPGILLAQEPAAGDKIEGMPEAAGETIPEITEPGLPADPEDTVPTPSKPEAVDVGPQTPSADVASGITATDELTGAPVYDPNDEEIGTLVGFTVNDAGKPEATVEFGGFLGIATKDVEVPLNLFSHGEDGQLIVDLTEDDLYEMYEVAKKESGEAPDS